MTDVYTCFAYLTNQQFSPRKCDSPLKNKILGGTCACSTGFANTVTITHERSDHDFYDHKTTPDDV
jgi:hypothetical protein